MLIVSVNNILALLICSKKSIPSVCNYLFDVCHLVSNLLHLIYVMFKNVQRSDTHHKFNSGFIDEVGLTLFVSIFYIIEHLFIEETLLLLI